MIIRFTLMILFALLPIACGPGIDLPFNDIGVFYAAGDNESILKSEDGRNWDLVFSGAVNTLNGIAAGNGTVVAVGNGDVVLTSHDGGQTWSYHTTGSGQALLDVQFINGQFIATGNTNTMYASSDGVTWGDVSSGISAGSINTIVYAEGRYIAYTTATPYVYYSESGLGPWTAVGTPPSFGAGSITQAIYDGSHFVGAEGGAGIAIWYSDDGKTSYANPSVPVTSLSDIIFAPNNDRPVYVAVDQSSTNVVGSYDRVNWQILDTIPNNGISIEYNGERYAIVGASGMILSSEDPFNWNTESSPVAVNLNALTVKYDK